MKKKGKASGGGGGSPHPSASPAAATGDGRPGDPLDVEGLKARIHEHSLFFDQLVELIPARYYLPADEDKPWFQGLSKAAKASAKAESRRHIKEARRARLDPSKPSPTTLDLLLQKNSQAEIASDADDAHTDDDGDEEEAEEEEDDDDESENEAGATRPVIKVNRSVTYEELRQRLHLRIQDLRAGRNTRPGANIAKPEKKDKKKNKKDKKNKKEGDATTSVQKRKRDDSEKTDANGDEKTKKSGKKKNQKGESNAVPTDLSFGLVKVGGEEEGMRKRRKLSKQQELERAMKLEEAKKDPEKGDIVSKKHSWKAAVDRAAGKKVHDDPKLLKESIKRENKRRKEHAVEWKERVKNVNMIKKKKQTTRSENIKERIQQKKMRRIEKREKKLLRPGFEGRKDGYVNE